MIAAAPMTSRLTMTKDHGAASSLTQRAMIVTLSLSMWRGQRIDRKLTQEVLLDKKAAADAGKFEKFLVPPKALEGVSKAQTRARAAHNNLSLPWDDGGARLVATTAFFDYTQAMNKERNNCENEYDAFCDKYPDLVAEAPLRLGAELFKAADFPHQVEIRQRFGFRTVILPVPDKRDFRVDIDSENVNRIQRDIEETVTERFATAQRELWERVLDTTTHFAATMAQEGKVFRDTTVTKLAELARIAPKITLMPDPKLDEICERILKVTDNYAPRDLRDNKRARQNAAHDVAAEIKAIEAAMAGAF